MIQLSVSAVFIAPLLGQRQQQRRVKGISLRHRPREGAGTVAPEPAKNKSPTLLPVGFPPAGCAAGMLDPYSLQTLRQGSGDIGSES